MGKTVQLNIFGEQEEIIPKKSLNEIRNDYDGFVKKFEPKKTTDDCYTPEDVYKAICGWVNDNVMPLECVRIVRPFYPGGDYENFDYQPGDFVLDNPPFSILAKIRRFYAKRGIGYFLFAPSLTLFTSLASDDETFIVAAADIKYENGAIVRTGFITNLMPGDLRVAVRGDLHKVIDEVQKSRPRKNADIPVYDYPATVITAARLQKIAERGINLDFPKDEVSAKVPRMDFFDKGKSIFGGGFFISERLAAEKLAAEKLAAEKLAERAKKIFILSDREKEIIKKLSKTEKI